MSEFQILGWIAGQLPANTFIPVAVVAVMLLTSFLTVASIRLFGRLIGVVLACPLIEELTFRIFLLGWVMTERYPLRADRAALLCIVAFVLAHLPTAWHTRDWMRALDGVIVGVINSVACLVYLRLFFPARVPEHWLIAYGALVVLHSAYNALTFSAISGLVRLCGLLLAIGAWLMWMPHLMHSVTS